MSRITIFGATGLVGRLAARYLADAGHTSVTLAGRNEKALKDLVNELRMDWSVAVANAKDTQALSALVESSDVVIATAGPYTIHGEPLVGLCAAAGVDYVDLCGEALFIRDSIDQHHRTAQDTGARIVHSCGFDSVPSDMGMFALHHAAGKTFDTVRMVVDDLRGGISEGTLASMRAVSSAAQLNKDRARLLHNPYTLDPDPKSSPRLEGLEKDFTIEKLDGVGWVGPFFMSMFNTRVVRRSNALRNRAYGERLFYKESWATGAGLAGRAKAVGLALITKALFDGTNNRFTRPVVKKYLPKPGQENSGFHVTHHGWTTDGEHWQTTVQAEGDPGYQVTAMMLCEAALCLIDSQADKREGGVLTPATALGNPYLERLTQREMLFKTRRVS